MGQMVMSPTMFGEKLNLSVVQSASNSGTAVAAATGITVTHSVPTVGSTLILMVGGVDGAAINIDTPAGYTAATTEQDQTNGADATVSRMFYRVADGTEGTTTKVTFSAATLDAGAVCFMELGGTSATPLDKATQNVRNDEAAATISTGTTAATTQAAEIVAAGAFLMNDLASTPTWSQSFIQVVAAEANGVIDLTVALAYKIVAETGAQETTADFTSPNAYAAGHIATFKKA